MRSNETEYDSKAASNDIEMHFYIPSQRRQRYIVVHSNDILHVIRSHRLATKQVPTALIPISERASL